MIQVTRRSRKDMQEVIVCRIRISIWKTLLSHVRYINRFKCDSSKRRSSSTTYENAVEHTASCRVTIIAFTVVTVFILSYLPSTVMKLLDTRTEWDIQDTDSTNNHFLHIFARSSCYLNHHFHMS
jgi:hypothetical protein